MDSKKAAIPSVLIQFQEQDDWKARKTGRSAGEEVDKSPVQSHSPISPESKLSFPAPALNEGFSLFQALFPLQKSLSTQERASLEVFTEANHVTIRPKCSSPDLSPSPKWTITRFDSLPSPPLAKKPFFRKKIPSKTRLINLDAPARTLPSLRTGLVRVSTLPSIGMYGAGRLGDSLTPRTKKATLPALSPNNRTNRQFPTF